MGFWLDPLRDESPGESGPGEQYGIFHRADRLSEIFCPGVLVVFVHGVNSDCRKAWTALPACLCYVSQVDADMFSFEFPSKFLQNASIENATSALRFALSEGFSTSYRELVFVVHSTGGLVVKQLMVADMEARLDGHVTDDGISARTHTIVNIAVPHCGGRGGLTEVARRLVVGAERSLFRISGFLRFVSMGRLDWGRNRILEQLRHQNPSLIELEKRYVELVKQCDDKQMHRPISCEILARSDVAASPYAGITEEFSQEAKRRRSRRRDISVFSDIGAQNYTLRGTHSTVKQPKRCTDLVVNVIAGQIALDERLTTYRRATDVTIAHGTHTWIETLDRAGRVESLFSHRSACDDEQLVDQSVKRWWRGGQQETLDELLRRIRLPADNPRRFVLTGGVGVGKSSVLRRLADHLSVEFTENPNAVTTSFLPIFVPMGRVVLKEQELSRFLKSTQSHGNEGFEIMMRSWRDIAIDLWRKGLFKSPHEHEFVVPHRSWYARRMRYQPTVLIFDAIDEFFPKNAPISLGDFRNMLTALERNCEENPRFVIVSGIRSTQPGLQSLATSSNDVMGITRVTMEEAESVLPGVGTLAARLQDASDVDFLLTPLILTHLSPQTDFHDERLQTRAGIIQAALEGVREWNDMPNLDDHLNALTLIGWRMFVRFRGEISTERLIAEANEAVSSWEKHLSLAKTPSDRPIAPPVPRHAHSTPWHTLATSPAQASPDQGTLTVDANESDECSVGPEPRWVARMEFSGETGSERNMNRMLFSCFVDYGTDAPPISEAYRL